ncbi:MAG: hypothetical protein RL757_374 [Bacteroidota bacterium]
MNKIQKLNRIFQTVRHLKFKQIQYQVFYRLRGQVRRATGWKFVPPQYNRPENGQKPLVLQHSIESYISNLGKNNFSFLNLTHQFEDKIDWNCPKFGKLWAYNLNYFEFLGQKNISNDEKLRLIDDFIEQYPTNREGCEPYPISLRLIFWIKFLSENQIQNEKINRSLWEQTHQLLDHLEYHLLGNHLLENAFGVTFAAYFFNDEKLFSTAEKLLLAELDEQILADGAHFELSPMYHQIIFYRVLDTLNLVKNNPKFGERGSKIQAKLEQKASRMRTWLENITFNSGDIPHFNDSIDGIAPTTKNLVDYANRLGVPNQNLPLQDSGYRKFVNPNFELIADIGKIGPDYIPGHAHSDTLNFVLYLKNKPFIIDKGISTYEKNAQRQLERQTVSHNVVQVEDAEQSDVWGGFRVGRRARVTVSHDNEKTLQAHHDGYKNFDIAHERTFMISENHILIEDYLENKKRYSLKAYFHFAAGIEPILEENHRVTFKNAPPPVYLTFSSKNNIKKMYIESFDLPLGYNSFVKSKKLVVIFDNHLTTTIGF